MVILKIRVFYSYASFRRHLRSVFDEHSVEQLPVKQVINEINDRVRSGQKFTDAEIQAAIERLSDDNAAMVADDNLILI